MATQEIVTPPSNAAIFLTLQVATSQSAVDTARDVLGDISGLTRSVNFRHHDADLKTVIGIGSDFWDRLTSAPRPKSLHPFPTNLVGEKHSAPSTPGDILLHVRAREMGMCWEVVRLVRKAMGDAVTVVDEVHGFRYFDNRDLLGFVDGTENPEGSDAEDAVLIGDEDPDYAGGSYVHIQAYTHQMQQWDALSVEEQERVIGRTKVDDVELDDDIKPSNSHVALNDIEDENGEDADIYRLNMPFASAETGTEGTFFISYTADPSITEQMLENMFIGDPPGNYDRILDFSTAQTGCMFFVPSVDVLDGIPDLPPAQTQAAEAEEDSEDYSGSASDIAPAPGKQPHTSDGSLGIGSLRNL